MRYLVPLLGSIIYIGIKKKGRDRSYPVWQIYLFRKSVLFPLGECPNEIVLNWLINFANKVEQKEIIVEFSGFRRMAAAQGPAVLSVTNGYQD